MRKYVAVIIMIAVWRCAAAQADPHREAVRIVDEWAAAFGASDVNAITALYADDATFFGTSGTAIVASRTDIRAYFERALLNNRPRGAVLRERAVTVLSVDAAVVSALDTLTGVQDGRAVSTSGRVTFVIAQRGAEWRIVHFHRSVSN